MHLNIQILGQQQNQIYTAAYEKVLHVCATAQFTAAQGTLIVLINSQTSGNGGQNSQKEA